MPITTSYPIQPKHRWSRPPNKYERHVDFARINDNIDRLEIQFVRAVRPFIRRMENKAAARIRQYESGRLRLFSEADKALYAKLYQVQAAKYHRTFGEITAAEVKTRFRPSRPVLASLNRDSRVITASNLDGVSASVAKNISRLLGEEVHAAALDDSQIPKIVTYLKALLIGGAKLVGAVAVATSLAKTREQIFADVAEDIYSYEFSAVLDGRQCPTCEDLDGMNLDQSDYDDTQWVTPIHHNCRCIWVAILEEQTEKPAYTKPVRRAGGLTSPPYFDWIKKKGLAV